VERGTIQWGQEEKRGEREEGRWGQRQEQQLQGVAKTAGS
jgi:hypothetical protein